jgi:hypothetical protein
MIPDYAGVWERMKRLGLSALAHTNRHAAYIDPDNPQWAEMSVLQAAHAAEILIKARIAQEHPLLIFDRLPKYSGSSLMSLEELFENGKSVDWKELPNRLWATTGIVLPRVDVFDRFGSLRNGIQHFSAPPMDINLSKETLQFVFSVIDPFIYHCWGLFAIDYDEDDASYENLPPVLIRYQIEFLISSDAAAHSCYWNIDWTGIAQPYKELIDSRVKEALSK